MRRPLRQSLPRLGLAAVAVLGQALVGCGDPAAPTPSLPSATPTPSSTIPRAADAGGSDGLTVRYLGDDGTVKTVRVEDFPR
jgi:hypothetical protein